MTPSAAAGSSAPRTATIPTGQPLPTNRAWSGLAMPSGASSQNTEPLQIDLFHANVAGNADEIGELGDSFLEARQPERHPRGREPVPRLQRAKGADTADHPGEHSRGRGPTLNAAGSAASSETRSSSSPLCEQLASLRSP